jgi:hypothetical protein
VVATAIGGVGCGLSLAGNGAPRGDAGTTAADASADATTTELDAGRADAATSDDGGAQGDDATLPDDAAVDAPTDACVLSDAGAGPLALGGFALKGNAGFNDNGDGLITLTNSNNDEHGAAWWPMPLRPVGGVDLSFKFRVGPGDTAGDGVAFAVIASSAMPDVGDNGDGIGIRNAAAGAPGFAVVVDMYRTPSDPTDLDKTTLKIVTLPSFGVIANVGIGKKYNDGFVYSADVSWRAPGSIRVTLQVPQTAPVTLSANDPGLAFASPAFFGFTGATGAASDSHQEIAGLSIVSTCE